MYFEFLHSVYLHACAFDSWNLSQFMLIDLAKEGGLVVIQIYVVWNGHEQQSGQVKIHFSFPEFQLIAQVLVVRKPICLRAFKQISKPNKWRR